MAAVGSVDVEILLIAWLIPRLDSGVTIRAELDNNLIDELPTVQVARVPGGGDDGFRVDRALVDVDVYAADRASATALSAVVRGLLLGSLPGSKTGGAVVGRVSTIAAPAFRPYENTALRRVGATYDIYFHPVS